MGSWTRITVFDQPGIFTWERHPDLYAIELLVRGSGGGGASGMSHSTVTRRICGAGGGGGATNKPNRRYGAASIPDIVEVCIGAGGLGGAVPDMVDGAWNPGENGGITYFGDLLSAEGGFGGGRPLSGDPNPLMPGPGGYGLMAGSSGTSASNTTRQGGTSIPLSFVRGGVGGSRGSGYTAAGGTASAGPVTGNDYGLTGQWKNAWALTHTNGKGGAGSTGTFPASPGVAPSGGGGGGAGGWPGTAGADGAPGRILVFEFLRDEEI